MDSGASLWDALVEIAFVAGAPASLAALAGRPDVRELADYAVSLVVPFGRPGHVRLAISDRRDPVAWERVVRAHAAAPSLDAFLAGAPRGVRRVLDSDGRDERWVYLDDLQDHAGVRGPDGASTMCRVLDPRSDTVHVVTRRASPPTDLESPALARDADRIARHQAGGIWGVRWRDHTPFGLLWISEARWRRRTSESLRVAAALDPPPVWSRLLDAVSARGALPYVDAIDRREEGGWDVTLGIVADASPART